MTLLAAIRGLKFLLIIKARLALLPTVEAGEVGNDE
jgi:hypothetical protein